MSTYPRTEHDDLDRTDELPRLDIAAYEARLAEESNDALSSTDTWAVEGLRDSLAARADETAALRLPTGRVRPLDAPQTDVALEATRILGRIEELEAELQAARERERDMASRLERLTNELTVKETQARGLTADNARLTEQRLLGIERVRELEQQLKDESAEYERELTQQRELRSAEQNAATAARLAHEQQLAELSTIATQLRDDNSRLDEEAQAATKLAQTQGELIEQFRQRLESEEKNAAQLALHLATKISEHATTEQELTRRDATIATLTESRDDLAALLDTSRRECADLTSQLADLTARYKAIDLTLRERDDAINALERRIASLESDLRSAQDVIATLTSERDELQRTLDAERDAQAQTQQALSARAQEIDSLHGSTEALHARIASLQEQLANEQNAQSEKTRKLKELERALDESQLRRDLLTREADSMRARLQQLENEVRQSASAREALNTKTTELQRIDETLAHTQHKLEQAQATLAAKQAEADELGRALNNAQEAAAELRRSNTALEHTVEETRQRLAQLEARERERESESLQHAADLADARRQLNQQLISVQSLEQAIRARDTLADRLRAELQTSQDERAIMAGQLEKSRARNKSMARDLFARDNQIAALKADLAVHVEALAAIRQDINRASVKAEPSDRILEPVDHVGDVIELNRKVMTIGRTSDNDICIPSKLVSRMHARLLIGPNAVIIEDAGSTNGCLVNDVQVKQHAMRDGDILSIGDLKYRLRTQSAHAPQDQDNVVIPFK